MRDAGVDMSATGAGGGPAGAGGAAAAAGGGRGGGAAGASGAAGAAGSPAGRGGAAAGAGGGGSAGAGGRGGAAGGPAGMGGGAAGGMVGAAGVGGGGAAGAAGRGGSGGGGGAGRGGAAGGAASAGGRGGAGAALDAGMDGPACSARFNFEAGALHGARANTGYQTSFTAIANTSDAFCGGGALRLDTTFDATNVKGEAIIALAAAEDVSGKTFSISYKASPTGPAGGYILVFLVPSYAIVLSQSAPVPATWTTRTVTLPSGADAGTSAATAISIQWLAGAAYTGALLVDEIDIR